MSVLYMDETVSFHSSVQYSVSTPTVLEKCETVVATWEINLLSQLPWHTDLTIKDIEQSLEITEEYVAQLMSDIHSPLIPSNNS